VGTITKFNHDIKVFSATSYCSSFFLHGREYSIWRPTDVANSLQNVAAKLPLLFSNSHAETKQLYAFGAKITLILQATVYITTQTLGGYIRCLRTKKLAFFDQSLK